MQPGLVSLMDGSVSTLAPVFAAAFGTQNISMGFAEALAAWLEGGGEADLEGVPRDDGKLSERGTPYLRGLV